MKEPFDSIDDEEKNSNGLHQDFALAGFFESARDAVDG
jgi:hypothetical protein